MLTIERLEDRLLLAANVTQSGGTLKITGDVNADAVLLMGGGQGNVEVFVDFDGDGMADDSLGAFTGVKNIKIDTQGGNDDVALHLVDVAGKVSVKTGDGSDMVILADCVIAKNVSIDTGAGNDIVVTDSVNDFNQVGSLNIKTGDGNDAIRLEGLEVNKSLSVNTGHDNDIFAFGDQMSAGSRTTFNGGSGNDFLVAVSANALEQQLAQLGARVRGFEMQTDFDGLDMNTVDAFNLRFATGLQKFNVF